MYEDIGSLQEKQKQIREARVSYKQSIEVSKNAIQLYHNNIWLKALLATSLVDIGRVLNKEDNVTSLDLIKAVDAYREALAAASQLTHADPDNAEWQRLVLISYRGIGSILLKEQSLHGSMASYQAALDVSERQAKSDPGSVLWQRELALSHDKVGDVFKAQGDLADAVNSYGICVVIRERLAKADPSSDVEQRNLMDAYSKLGEVLRLQGRRPAAVEIFRKMRSIVGVLSKKDFVGSNEKIGGLSYRFLLAGEFTTALAMADQAIAHAPNLVWAQANRAHALMFLGRLAEAKAIYFEFRGKDAYPKRSWESVVRSDFAELRNNGFDNELMSEIDNEFDKGARPKHAD